MKWAPSQLREDTKNLLRLTEIALEILVLSLIYYVVWTLGYDLPYFQYNGKYVLVGLYAFLLYIFFQSSDAGKFSQLHYMDLVMGQLIALFLTNFITYFQLCLIANKMLSPLPMLILYGVESIVAVILVFIYTRLYYRLYAPHDMLLIYGNERGIGLKIKMDARHDKYNISRLISSDESFSRICEEILQHDAVVMNDVPAEIRNDILKFCFENKIRTYISPKITDILIRGGKNITLFDNPLFLIKGMGLTAGQRFAKRLMDIVLCTVSLVVTLPVMAVISLAIKLEDGGPVLFKQERLTLNREQFMILKFRSMIPDAEKYSGAVLASGDDPRITKVGKFLRTTRLDELPQIFNILKGDMSIVGPRPERKVIADEYCKELPEFSYRLKVRSGLTGYAQVYGKYNTTPYDKLRLDLMYIENYSILLDIRLIILTLRILFCKESTEGIEVTEQNKQSTQELIDTLRANDK